MMTWEMWAIIGTVLAVAETATLSFFLLSIGIGGWITALITWLGADLEIQLLTFFLVNTVLITTLRPLFTRLWGREAKISDADAVLGQEGIVAETSPKLRIQVRGSRWFARWQDEPPEQVRTGMKVRVIDRQNNTLTVTPIVEE